MTNDYTFWRNALAGKAQPVHEGEPQCGFWYQRQKDGPRVPVAIYRPPDDDELIALVGTEPGRVGDPVDLWTWVCQHPVTEEIYREVFRTGAWPDDPPPAPEIEEDDADPFTAISTALAGELKNAEVFLEDPIKTKEAADKAAAWAKQVGDLAKKADTSRKSEKEAGRAVDDKWRDVIEDAKDLTKRLKEHITPFLKAQAQAETARQKQEADKAAELRKKAAEANDPDTIQDLNEKAAEAAKAAEKKSTAAGRTGAKVSLRTHTIAVITDFDACYAALKSHPDMIGFVQTLADRACRAKVPLAGVEFQEEQKAA